jgi:AcrR family transcriptional regulator
VSESGSQPTRRKGHKRERTRARLIEAAGQVIGEKGYDRASLEEIAARAGMTRGAVYGNFRNKEELFLALIEAYWQPITVPFEPDASFRTQMGKLGRAVAREARLRRDRAAAATAFQLYVITNAAMRERLTAQNRLVYQRMALELKKKVPEGVLPLPAEEFICVLDALITGLLFTYFQTPELVTEAVFVGAFEALAPAS